MIISAALLNYWVLSSLIGADCILVKGTGLLYWATSSQSVKVNSFLSLSFYCGDWKQGNLLKGSWPDHEVLNICNWHESQWRWWCSTSLRIKLVHIRCKRVFLYCSLYDWSSQNLCQFGDNIMISLLSKILKKIKHCCFILHNICSQYCLNNKLTIDCSLVLIRFSF